MSGHTHYLNAVTKRCIVCGKTDREINAPSADPWDACLSVDPPTGQPDHGTDFYEDDEPAGQIRAEWAAAPKHLTGMEHEPDGCGHGDACPDCTD